MIEKRLKIVFSSSLPTSPPPDDTKISYSIAASHISKHGWCLYYIFYTIWKLLEINRFESLAMQVILLQWIPRTPEST